MQRSPIRRPNRGAESADRKPRGRGLANEAAPAIRDYGQKTLGHARLVSIIHRDNLASRRVAVKTGMAPERMIQFMNHRCWLYAIEATK